MASYSATVSSTRPPDEVFAHLADFRSVADWDPLISESVHTNDDDPIKVGAIFRVTTETTLKNVVLEHTTVELDRPHKIVLRGENDSMVSLDRITVRDDGLGGAGVSYQAEIGLKGARRLADPLLALGFRRLGDKARDGLGSQLNSDA